MEKKEEIDVINETFSLFSDFLLDEDLNCVVSFFVFSTFKFLNICLERYENGDS